MGRYVRYGDGVESLLRLTELLRKEGDIVAPRGQATQEIRDLMIEIDDPSDVTMSGIGRNWNPKIAIAEFLQLAGGFSDPDAMRKISTNFARFMDGGAFHGAYGPRTSMQFAKIAERLAADPDTRQGVVTVWDPLHDLMQEGKKDLPCTVSFNFTTRSDRLLMTTHMRSNDVWWGWSYDLFQFTQLQWTIGNSTGLPIGSYTHFANSFHLYDRDQGAALGLAEPDTSDRPSLTGIGLVGQPWNEIQQVATEIFYGTADPDDLTNSEKWMLEALHD